MKNKGFFATVIVALLITLALSILATKLNYKNSVNETIEDYITTLDLVYERTNFEYNLRNVLQINLNRELAKSLDKDIVKPIIDQSLKTFLEETIKDSNFTSILDITSDINSEIEYMFSIHTSIEKEIIYKGKKIILKIPDQYIIKNKIKSE